MHTLTALPVTSSLHHPIACRPMTENIGLGIMLSFFPLITLWFFSDIALNTDRAEGGEREVGKGVRPLTQRAENVTD